MTATFDTVRSIEKREIDKLGAHLSKLDDDGWLEQSYCAEWRVYQVVSHVSSGARIFLGLLEQWFDEAPPMSQERMREIWGHFDALKPGEMHAEFQSAMRDYFARLMALPSADGEQEVDSFFGRMPTRTVLAFRLNEVVLHTWDVLVARDRLARLPDDALDVILPTEMHIRGYRMPAALAGKRVRLSTSDGTFRRYIDFRGERPVISAAAVGEADITVEAPAEEMARLLSGRHFLPGSLPKLTWQGGSYTEVMALNIFGA